jgi:hypothetical protein
VMWSIVLVLAACAGQIAAPATSQPAKPSAVPIATRQTAEPSVTAEPTAASEPVTGGDLALDSRNVGLDKLKSYRVTWKADWATTKDGKTENTTWDWREEYSADPNLFHFTWKGTDASGKEQGGLELWQMWQSGGLASMVSIDQEGTKSCSSLLNPSEDWVPTGFFSPSMLGSLSGAKYAGTEVVNGIRSNHYKYDEKAAKLAGFDKVSGEIWVAADGGYVVKDTVSWEGGAGPFGAPTAAGESGKGGWTWELTDPNSTFTIPLPDGCHSAADGLPVISGAYRNTVTGDVAVYQTLSTPAKVVAFYQEQMTAGGWKQSGEPASKDGVATVEFTKDGQKASVTITTKGQTSDVMIKVTKEQ